MINFLVQEYDKKCHEIVQKTAELSHQGQILRKHNKNMSAECQAVHQQNQKLGKALQKLQNILFILQKSQNDSKMKFDPDPYNIRRNQELIDNFKPNIISEEQIIDDAVVCIPDGSLQKVQTFLSELTQQQLAELVTKTSENRKVIQNLHKTRQKYDKIRQNKCKNFKEPKNYQKKDTSNNKKDKK